MQKKILSLSIVIQHTLLSIGYIFYNESSTSLELKKDFSLH